MTHQIIIFLTLILFASCSGDKKVDTPHISVPIKANNFKMNSHMDTINTDKFWSLVDNAVRSSNGDNTLKEKYLTTELEKLSLDEIMNFEIAFRKCVIDADDFRVMAAQKIIEDYVSDDTY